MTTRSDGRKLIQLTMKPDLYEQIKDHCRRLDIPITAWARQLISREIANQSHPSNKS